MCAPFKCPPRAADITSGFQAAVPQPKSILHELSFSVKGITPLTPLQALPFALRIFLRNSFFRLCLMVYRDKIL
jgi:hypothetical protein